MIATERPPTQDDLFDEAFLRKLARLDILTRRLRAGVLRGERRSVKRGQSVEFADYRTYSHGDDLRRVDWNAYARFERAFLKLYHEEEDRTVHVLVDVSPSMDWGTGDQHKLTYARRTAAALGYIALAGLDRVALATVGSGLERQAPVLRGTGALVRLLAFLREPAPLDGTTDLDRALGDYARRAHQPGPLFLLSDLFGTAGGVGKAGLLALAGRGYEVTVLHVLAADELAPTLRGDLKLVDRETGAARELTVDDAALARYQRALEAWRADLTAYCATYGLRYLVVPTSLPFEELLLASLRRAGVLA